MMKRTLTLIFTVFLLMNSNAQSREAYINDPDGYTNVRQEGAGTSEIIYKIHTGQLFFCKPTNTNWWKIKALDGREGFVHKSRVVFAEDVMGQIHDLMVEIIKTSSTNVEFSEASNEYLFEYLEKYPLSFISALDKITMGEAGQILNELKHPIHDGFDLRKIYNEIDRIPGESLSKKLLLNALKEAGA